MMMVFLTAPACLLSFFLAYLCYKRAYYRHMLVLSVFAVCMMVVTISILGVGYFMLAEMSEEFAAALWTPNLTNQTC